MPSRLIDIASHRATGFAVLATGIVLSAAAAYWTAKQLEREVRLKFTSAVEVAREAVDSRIRAYSDVLLGVRGLFIASDSVSRSEFRDYIDSLELGRRYPGIQGINYAQRISAAQVGAFAAMARQDTSVDLRGYPQFTIKPPGSRPEYVVVKYVEPTAGNEGALCLDLAGDPVRLAALERTRDSGRITASGIIALSHDPRRHPGFAMRLPVYRNGMPLATVAQRREAFAGMVSAAFVVIDLMNGVLNESFLQSIHVRIHDAGFVDDGAQGLRPASAENLMFDSDRLLAAPSGREAAAAGELAGLSSVSGLEIGGRRWEMYFSARRDLASFFDRWLPLAVMLGGSIISLLLFGLIRSLASVGGRATALAANITEDLRRSEAKLTEAQRVTQELIEVLPNPVFFKRIDGRYLGVNKAWERYFGIPREAFLGKTVFDLYPNDPSVAQRLHAQDQMLWQHPATQVYETVITTADGKRHDTIYYKAPLTNADGSVAGLIGTIIDITERKHAEEALRVSEARFRSLTEMSSDFYWESDAEHRLTQRGAAIKTGSQTIFHQPTPIGARRWEIRGVSPDDAGWAAHRADLEAHRPFRNFEFSRLGADGTERYVSISGDPVIDASGEFKGYRGVGTDVTERKRAELRASMEHGVTRLLSEFEIAEQAMPAVIRTICEALGFACGARVLRDADARTLRCAETWSVPVAEVMEFVAAARPPMYPGQAPGGLIQRAWAGAQPVWISDVAGDAGFRRAPRAAKAGLRAALAFPILFGDEVLGVMEFFGRTSRPPDEVLLQSVRSIGAQIGQFMARRQAEERVHHLAHYDELTGLPNRSMFNQRLSHALAQARRNEKPLAILFIDLDRFKNINDTLGHEAGDRVLEEVARKSA